MSLKNRIVPALTAWLERPRVAAAVSLASMLLVALVATDAALGFDPALRALYVMPLWLATRLGGRWAGWALVAMTTVVGCSVDLATSPHREPLWACATLHLAALGAVMLAIARLEEALWKARKQAMNDPLTGLLNRRALKAFAGDAVARVASLKQPLSVVLVDCDDFKAVNDTYGHDAGDHVLQILARVLETETRQTDLIARTGGDEFVLVLPGSDEEEARGVMVRVERAFVQRVQDAGYTAGISAGLASLGKDDTTIDALLRGADKAMYTEKKRRKRAAYLN